MTCQHRLATGHGSKGEKNKGPDTDTCLTLMLFAPCASGAIRLGAAYEPFCSSLWILTLQLSFPCFLPGPTSFLCPVNLVLTLLVSIHLDAQPFLLTDPFSLASWQAVRTEWSRKHELRPLPPWHPWLAGAPGHPTLLEALCKHLWHTRASPYFDQTQQHPYFHHTESGQQQ